MSQLTGEVDHSVHDVREKAGGKHYKEGVAEVDEQPQVFLLFI